VSSGHYFTVPPGTHPSQCRDCPRPIYWIETKTGAKMPVDCNADARSWPPSATDAGSGLSHFATCPSAAKFRKGR